MCEKIVAPCGIDCFNCEMYEENVTLEFQERLCQITKIPKEKISCKGCKDNNICLLLEVRGKKCSTLECVKKHGVEYCFQCTDFPCAHLMPLADGAAKFPQNIKLYNLCLMKKEGLDAFIEKAAKIRSTYFNKKLEIGEGGI